MENFMAVMFSKFLADKFVEMEMISLISNIVGNPTILRAYTGAYMSVNKGNYVEPVIPSSRVFFNILFKVLVRSYDCRTEQFWRDFVNEILDVYPLERTGYVTIGDHTLLYKGEDDFFPWVVATSDHPNNSTTFLDRTIGEEVFNKGVGIYQLVERYGIIDPYSMADRIQYDRKRDET